MNEIIKLEIESWHLKAALPSCQDKVKPVIFLLHGLSGDEDSMWVFLNQLNLDAYVFAPRAPFPSRDIELGGYSWVDKPISYWPKYEDFFQSLDLFNGLIGSLEIEFPYANFNEISLIGFSQGGAFSYSYAVKNSNKVEKIAVLSGFLPEGVSGYFMGVSSDDFQLFIAHGEKDQMVSIREAEDARDFFQGKQFSVTYCVSNTAHRLGKNCKKEFEKFIEM